jgi:hypothetical protein
MYAQGFLAALAPAVTDADARERFLANPKAALAASGLDLPEWFTVTAREGDAPELTITVPGLLDPDTELSDEHLEAAVGGAPLWCPCGGWQHPECRQPSSIRDPWNPW